MKGSISGWDARAAFRRKRSTGCWRREREVRCLKQHRRPPVHPLLYQRVPVKTAAEWDRQEVGNLQLDYVLHCGRSTAGEYLLTLSATDIATGWWEGSPQKGRSQKATQESLERIRQRMPFRMREVHPDNDSGILNDLLWNYCRRHRIRMSRSRPYQKNDNAWVEQKNWTHVRKVVGLRAVHDGGAMRDIAGSCMLAAADFRNFLQPAMKLKEKVREGGKVRRVYEEPRTPYQRLLELGTLKPPERRALEKRYQAIGPGKAATPDRTIAGRTVCDLLRSGKRRWPFPEFGGMVPVSSCSGEVAGQGAMRQKLK